MATIGMVARAGDDADGSMGAPVDDAGRGLATSAAERTNFESPAAGAWGTTILRKQGGQLSCPPLVLESAVMCWPQTGHANLNSLISSFVNHSTGGEEGQFFFPTGLARDFLSTSPQIRLFEGDKEDLSYFS